MTKRWNEKVKPNDTVYYLGDFCLHNDFRPRMIMDKLNGKIHLVKGNHDYKKALPILKDRVESISDLLEVTIQDKEFKKIVVVLCHYPLRTWHHSNRGSIHLHGHCHGNLPENDSLSMDVGVDTNNFYPYSFEEVKNKLRTKKLWDNFYKKGKETDADV